MQIYHHAALPASSATSTEFYHHAVLPAHTQHDPYSTTRATGGLAKIKTQYHNRSNEIRKMLLREENNIETEGNLRNRSIQRVSSPGGKKKEILVSTNTVKNYEH